MKNTITIIAIVFAVMVSGAVAVATVPSSTAANAGDSNEITGCTIIDESGEYALANDLANESAETCLDIQADDVTIDGNGHTVDGVDGNGTGVESTSRTNVTIRNVTVTGFETGVRFTETTGAIHGATVENNDGDGVAVDRSENYELTIEGSELSNNGGAGVSSFYSDLVLTDNRIVGNGDGGVVGDDTYVRSTGNVVSDNDGVGIATGLGGVNSTDDVVKNNTEDGISVAGAAIVDGSTIENNGDHGVRVLNSGMNTGGISVEDSEIVANGGAGVYVEAGAPTELTVSEIHGSVIADNDGLGVNNEETVVINATGNYWGESDGPSSATDEHAPFEDPVTGKFAMGIGDEVSENPEQQGVSNVHFDPFLTENPNADDGTDDQNDSSPREISECTVIDESGTYEIVSDITNESAELCIDVQASDVVIDGNGHTIDGVDMNGTGIGADAVDNVTVRDVTVTGFDTGVTSAGTAEVTLVDSTVERNGFGVTVGTVDTTLRLQTSIVTNNTHSGVVVDSGSATISNSQLTNNGERGLFGFLTADVTMRTSLVAGNTIGVEMGEASLVSENNTVRDNEQLGMKVAGTLESTDDNVYRNGAGIRGGTDTTLAGTWVTDNERFGVKLLAFEPDPTVADITGSRIAENGGDGVRVGLNGDHEEFDVEIHDSAIVDNDGLGVNNTATKIVNATGNDWGSDDGPGSADDPDAPFADPVTGHLADGSGDEVSEHPEKPGVSNVHFTTEAPEDDSDQNDGDQNEGDQNDGDEKERSSDDAAYQFDVAVGEVIEDLGEDADSFYGTQGRLVRAQTVAANGTVTGHFMAPSEDYADATDGCEVYGSTVDYDSENGTVTATLSHTGDADCGNVTTTFAAYELPGDDVTFVREHADGQELVSYRTVTLEPGEEIEITLSLDE